MANRYWVGGTGQWNTTNKTNWSTTAGGAGGASIPTSADNVFFDRAATYTVYTTGNIACANLTVSAGTVTFSNVFSGTTYGIGISLYGNFSITSSTVWSTNAGTTSGGPGITIAGSTAQTFTTNGAILYADIYMNSATASLVLGGALTLSSGNVFKIWDGSLNLNGFTLTAGYIHDGNTASDKTIAFGTGNITLTGSGSVTSDLWHFGTSARTITGTPTVNITTTTSTAIDVYNRPPADSPSAASGINLNVTTGSFGLTLFGTFLSVNFTGYSGAVTFYTAAISCYIYGNFTASAGMSFSEVNSKIIFAGTSGTQTINTAGKSIGFPITFDGVGGTFLLASDMNMTSTQTATLNNGTLSLSSYNLTAGVFLSSNSNARTIAFGTGRITVIGTGTIFDATTVTNLSITGSPKVYVNNNTVTAATVSCGNLSEASSISFYFVSGTYSLTLSVSTIDTLDFTGFSGTLNNIARLIYGSLVLSSGMTLTAGNSAMTFAATSGTSTITTAGKTLDFPVTFNGAGGTWQLADNMTFAATRTLTHTNGIINLNGKILNCDFYSVGAGTKNLTFNGGTLTIDGSGSTAFNNANPTGFTTTAGTGTGKISMTSASAKTFVGAGSTYACTLAQAGAGTLTITGSNTFNDISNDYSASGPTKIVFPASATQTVGNFSAVGTNGNELTIDSSSAGVQATLSKASGTVSSQYLILQDSNATGGANWSTKNSQNGGNITGWLLRNDAAFMAFF